MHNDTTLALTAITRLPNCMMLPSPLPPAARTAWRAAGDSMMATPVPRPLPPFPINDWVLAMDALLVVVEVRFLHCTRKGAFGQHQSNQLCLLVASQGACVLIEKQQLRMHRVCCRWCHACRTSEHVWRGGWPLDLRRSGMADRGVGQAVP